MNPLPLLMLALGLAIGTFYGLIMGGGFSLEVGPENEEENGNPIYFFMGLIVGLFLGGVAACVLVSIIIRAEKSRPKDERN